jgi:hypothetical protein
VTIQSVSLSEKDVPKKVILEKDVPEKDMPEKNVQKKDVPKKDMPEKDVPEKAINEDVHLQGITAVVPVEVLPTLATWLYMCLMPGEVLRFSITLSRGVEYRRKSLLTTSRIVGIFPYAVTKARTTLNGSVGVVAVGPFAVARRLIWTWSMIVYDDISRVCLEVTYDPTIGLVVRVTFQCVFWLTTPEKGPTLEIWELNSSNSTANCTIEETL